MKIKQIIFQIIIEFRSYFKSKKRISIIFDQYQAVAQNKFFNWMRLKLNFKYFQAIQIQQLRMKILIKKILSLHEDGANSYLLVIDQKYKILLDCGINHGFDFSKYREIANQLKDLRLVLISHSAIEYSGAYPFLVSELGISPKIFYTTQPIMRYSPLNLHEEILNLRIPTYNQKIFNRIYTEYEEMNLVKPYQKQELILTKNPDEIEDERFDSVKQTDKKIHFCCYLAGGYLGSVYWRISFGLINIVYLVDYNNYNMQHIGGLDLENLRSQSTHLLLTDAYPRSDDMKRDRFYQNLKEKVVNFYQQNNLDPSKPKMFNPDHDSKLLISCYPTELTVQILATMSKIVAQLQQGGNVQKIGMVHLSSRFLELVKSQSEYFQPQFKGMLQKLDDYFKQSLAIDNRITVCPYQSTRGILATPQLRNVSIYSISSDELKEFRDKESIKNNIRGMRLFFEDDYQRLNRSSGKISLSKIESKGQIKHQVKEQKMDEQLQIKQQDSIDIERQKQEQMYDNFFQKKHINSKYISAIAGIPRFILDKKEKDEEVTEYGLRHHCQHNQKNQRKTIYDVAANQNQTFDQKMMSKKTSKIQVMNICFKLPETLENGIELAMPFAQTKNIHKTEYNSSLKIIQMIKPSNIILLNVPNNGTFRGYQAQIPRLFSFQNNEGKKVNVFDINAKKNCYLSFENELLQYKMNYLPEMQQKKVQKVKGTIIKEGNCLHIRLDCLEDKQITHFKLDQFYLIMKKKMASCIFIGGAIEVEGIKIYRKDNEIILQGQYSQEYFKIRKELYEFLGLR